MVSSTTQNYAVNQCVQAMRCMDADEQLALFWFIYKEMGKSVTPAAPAASTVSPEIAEGLFNQVKEMSREEQLQIQRDLINRADTQICREYGSLSDTTKLLFWYFLAQGMDNGTVIPMPEGYEMSDASKDVLNQIVLMPFEQQITLFREYVSPMGAEAKAGSEI